MDCAALRETIKSGDVYEHYKGKRYRVLSVSCCSETLSWSIVYETLYDNEISTIWHRPLEMFLGTLCIDQKKVVRFKRIEE